MREEDLDWLVYCQIVAGAETGDDLAARTGQKNETIEASLVRLERYLLIERSGDTLRPLSVQESLIKCQCTYSRSLPIYIEDGVIKVKRDSG
ncbi:MAG: MarR family transcriptional regulator [Methanomicrobiaceae archaeon]|uniref:MarR family transcriptional regulator n=1 Tax=hydrocarbon metagenome TaxID=938273 RepID=A0A0W8FKI3_9ZZZZ|nr:MarR family transcriptional regulator [Methanomicrobiaceae archaeon]MDD5419864.1 MarR family transcriptional regulator [Methanomicrobiaceae archaeon]